MNRRTRSSREHAYWSIRDQIMTLTLPPGSKVSEAEIGKAISASRTPVREALSQLASEGLIDIGVNGGYFVSTIDVMTLQSLLEAHLLVVRATTNLLVAHVRDHELAQLRQAAELFDEASRTNDPALVSQRSNELHVLETELGGNPYITMLSDRVYAHLQRLSYLSFRGIGNDDLLLDDNDEAGRHHWEYIEAIEARDLPKAEEIATRHAELFRKRMLLFLNLDGTAGIRLDDLVMAANQQDPSKN